MYFIILEENIEVDVRNGGILRGRCIVIFIGLMIDSF